jgi:glycosyltransferase involved in cell wall biosynthesis
MTHEARKRLKVGLWCDYGFTLKPTEGIGVFVANLLRGLSDVPDAPDIAILVHPGDEHVYDEAIGGIRDHVSVISTSSSYLLRTRRILRAGWHWKQLAAGYLRAFGGRAREKAAGARRRLPDALLLERLFPPYDGRGDDDAPPASVPVEIMKVGAVVLAALVSALAIGLAQVLIGLVLILFRPLEILLHRFHFVVRALLDHYGGRLQDAVARRAGRDVWILPYVGMPVPRIHCPFIVIVHDIVYRHYPESFSPEHYDLLETTVQRITRAAAISACASRFILETDLLGILGLPQERTRCVRHAVPKDILAVAPTPPQKVRDRLQIQGRYLLYPAAFRGYKNHRVLIEALAELRRAGQDLDLVLTGKLPAPAYITEAISAHDLKEHVHLVDQVTREDLAGLYQGAEATIVPTLYEQGSFPVLEAMSLGCPVACSRIPPLLEQHEEDLDAMVFFDPLSPVEIARAVELLQTRRTEYQRRQSFAFERMLARTWRDVAEDWLAVCHDAVELGDPFRPGPSPAPALRATV